MLTVYTIGHSTRPLDEFVEALRSFSVECVADVRTIPRSRHNPQFGQDVLSEALPAAGIDYVHMKELGGLRHARADSRNTGLRNSAFRGYADYMGTPEFEAALETLIRTASARVTAVMCAEALPWRCHRSLIADALVARGIAVEHILSPGVSRKHALSPMAVVRAGRLTYPMPPAFD